MALLKLLGVDNKQEMTKIWLEMAVFWTIFVKINMGNRIHGFFLALKKKKIFIYFLDKTDRNFDCLDF